MARAIKCNLGEYGGVVDLVNPAIRRHVVRMLARMPWPAEYRDHAFEQEVDLGTVRALVVAHRHVETGLWGLRIDGLANVRPVWRHQDPSNDIALSGLFRHLGGDYGDLTDFSARYNKTLLPDGTSRLLARTIKHYADQIFGEDKLATWGLPIPEGLVCSL